MNSRGEGRITVRHLPPLLKLPRLRLPSATLRAFRSHGRHRRSEHLLLNRPPQQRPPRSPAKERPLRRGRHRTSDLLPTMRRTPVPEFRAVMPRPWILIQRSIIPIHRGAWLHLSRQFYSSDLNSRLMTRQHTPPSVGSSHPRFSRYSRRSSNLLHEATRRQLRCSLRTHLSLKPRFRYSNKRQQHRTHKL